MKYLAKSKTAKQKLSTAVQFPKFQDRARINKFLCDVLILN